MGAHSAAAGVARVRPAQWPARVQRGRTGLRLARLVRALHQVAPVRLSPELSRAAPRATARALLRIGQRCRITVGALYATVGSVSIGALRFSEPNDPVFWIDQLPAEAFAEGFGLQATPAPPFKVRSVMLQLAFGP
jgi:hypothetical protein